MLLIRTTIRNTGLVVASHRGDNSGVSWWYACRTIAGMSNRELVIDVEDFIGIALGVRRR